MATNGNSSASRSARAKREARDDEGRFERSFLGFDLPSIDTRTATIGAAVVATVGVGAALFAGWRNFRSTTDGIADASDRGFATRSGGDSDLHALGTPSTMAVDGGVRRYSGDGAPDMAVNYVPGEDPTSLDNEDTRRS